MAKRTGALSSRRYAYTPELLAHGRHRYEHTEDSIPDIAVEFGIHKTTLLRLAKREGWVRYAAPPRDVSVATRLAEQAAALEEAAQKGAAAPSDLRLSGGGEQAAKLPAAIDAEIEELLAAVTTEREIYKAMRARLKHLPQSPLDAERTTRTLSQLTATLHRIQRLRAGQIDITPEDRQHDNDNVPTDIDARRDALARRIAAFMESRTDEECGLGPDGRPVDRA